MKIRLTIEYDPDMPDGSSPEDFLEEETQDWLNGHVAVLDFIKADSFEAADESVSVRLEAIE